MDMEPDQSIQVCPTCRQNVHVSADRGLNYNCPHCGQILNQTSDETALNGQMSPVSAKSQKARIFISLGIAAIIALLSIILNPPRETGWWIFKTVSTPYQFLVGSAFLLSVGYLFLMVHWYQGKSICAKTSLLAFLLSGGLSILFTLLLNPILGGIGVDKQLIETGVWIFRETRTVTQYDNAFVELLHHTSAIAGIVEEPAKLLALLAVPAVRKAIVDRRSGIYFSTLCAFGFAFVENVAYFQANQGILFFRANPAHAVFSSLWGAALGSLRKGNIGLFGFAKFLLFGIGLHALWNVLASTDPTLFLIAFAATIWLGLSFIKRELSDSNRLPTS